MIKAVIIDDELAMQEVNSSLLSEYFPEIELVGTGTSIKNGIDLIERQNPDLVLLDIELNDGNSFQLLQKLKPYKFKIVFITGYNSYAIKAIKFSALDYILKPINEVEFQSAIQRAVEQINTNIDSSLQNAILMESYKKETQTKKIVLKTTESLHILDISNILFCRSDNSYTTFYLEGNEKVVVSKPIKDYDELLCEYGFFRPHQSYLVNLNHVKKIDKTDGGFIIMKNKKEIPVSIRQKRSFIKLLEEL